MSNETTVKARAPKTAVEKHRGLTAGSRIAAGEATIFLVDSQPRRDNPSVKEALYALVRVPCPDGGTITLKMDRIDCPAGTHANRQNWLANSTVGMPLGELEVIELWERNGRVQGRVSARKPAEERIIREWNSGERILVDALVVDTMEKGIRLNVTDGIAKDWNIFVHVSNVPGGDATINKLQAETDILTVVVVNARQPDKTKKTEENRVDIVLQGSFEVTEDKKRADADLLEALIGDRSGRLEGTVVGSNQTHFIIEMNIPSKTTFEWPASQRFFPKIGDVVPLRGVIEGGELKAVPAKGHK